MKPTSTLFSVALAAATLAGCLDTAPDTGQTEQEAITPFGWIYQAGALQTFQDVTGVTGIDLSKLVGVAACDATALYGVQRDQVGLIINYSLWFSNTSGQSWTKLSLAGKSPEIACDHAQLVTLDASRQLYTAQTHGTGVLDPWVLQPNSVQVDRIQGGDGTIYGVKRNGNSFDVYLASGQSIGQPLVWSGPIVTGIGASLVTGTGAQFTGTDHVPVSPPHIPQAQAWPIRAFDLEADGSISTNPKLLSGVNSWSWFNTGSERYKVITAAASNLLYGIQIRDGVTHLNRITIEENSCFDGIDNDANGLIDSEDPKCVQAVANDFCSTHAVGFYCSDRYQPSSFLGQPNQGTSLTTCTGPGTSTVKAGTCKHNPNPATVGLDYLPSIDEITAGDPIGTARYCNTVNPDGTWGFSADGTDPCAALLAVPGSRRVRAGLYSTTGSNNILVGCSDGGYLYGGTGKAALLSAYLTVGHTANRCIFSISAGSLPLFDSMFFPSEQLPLPRRNNPFDHVGTPPVPDISIFAMGQSGPSQNVDRTGHSWSSSLTSHGETAYDIALDEGQTLLAPANGVVIATRMRAVSSSGCSPNQGEIYVKYNLGSDPEYREAFVVYYAHVRDWVVAPGQTVKTGQILGYVGATGCTGGFGHLHIGTFRVNNNHMHTAAAPWLGYQFDFQATTAGSGNNTNNDNTVDPLGWANTNAFDPWGSSYFDQSSAAGFIGVGAWSANLFKPGKGFRFDP